MINVDLTNLGKKIDFDAFEKRVLEIDDAINNKTMAGNDFLGWADYPLNYDKEEFERIKKDAEYVRNNFDVLVVCGIGGSYLGARAAIEAINGFFPDKQVEIMYLGQTVAPSYVTQALRYLKNKRFAVNVISKSGTTTETAISFRMLRDLLVEQLGVEGASKAIFATTDAKKGALLELSKKYGYTRYVLPSDIGGRYSVFTAVGLFPMAVAGIDIDGFMNGMKIGRERYGSHEMNDCYKYAVVRHVMHKKLGYPVEMLVTYEPKLVQLGEWWKQLFGESEGKEHTGLLPDSATFTTDLHSLGQFIQEGSPVLFETCLSVIKPANDIDIPHDEDNLDGLNYLDGRTLDYVQKKAMMGTIEAHSATGGVPNILITLDRLTATTLGELMYFFMRACAMGGYLNGINPFNQPGVEVYKKNMFHLLGKPGY